MLVVFDSMTGNVARFIHKLPYPSFKIEPGLKVKEDFILITYTTGFGKVPEAVTAFLKESHPYLKGVAASGNRNWGHNFAISAEIVAKKYRVPVILKFELAGMKKDIELFIKGVEDIEVHRIK